VETVCKLLLLLEDLLLISEAVAEGYVLEAELCNLLILLELALLLRLNKLLRDLLAGAAVNCILRHTALKFFELILDLFAFSLLLV